MEQPNEFNYDYDSLAANLSNLADWFNKSYVDDFYAQLADNNVTFGTEYPSAAAGRNSTFDGSSSGSSSSNVTDANSTYFWEAAKIRIPLYRLYFIHNWLVCSFFAGRDQMLCLVTFSKVRHLSSSILNWNRLLIETFLVSSFLLLFPVQ